MRTEMKSKSVSSSESEDSDEGVDPDLENEDSDDQDFKHTEDDLPRKAAPVVSVAPDALAPVVLPRIVPRNTAALALAHGSQSRKKAGHRTRRL